MSKNFYKIALGVEYNGSKYCGWQRQNNVLSIQEKIEIALSKIANEPINVFCGGRTDTGVHSTGQVIHFETTSLRKDTAWTLGVNTNLPNDIAINWAKSVPNNFHARFSAISRKYRYVIYNHKLRSALLNKRVAHYYHNLNIKKMNYAAQCLIGENDFTSFRTIECQSNTPRRKIVYININRFGNYVIIDIKANSFLHRMVRKIIGSLIEVGKGRRSENWIAEILAAKNRNLAAFTAKSDGLYLISIDYPKHFNLPKSCYKFNFY